MTQENRLGTVVINGEERTYKKGFTAKEYTPWAKHTHGSDNIMAVNVTEYINLPEVRKAMNIPDSV